MVRMHKCVTTSLFLAVMLLSIAGHVARVESSIFVEWEVPGWKPWDISVYGGLVYFAELPGGRIGRLNPSTGQLTAWTIPAYMLHIVDGIVYFTEPGGDKIGRLDPTTGVFTEWIVPTAGSSPCYICVYNGLVYFTEFWGNKIGRLDPATGIFTEWTLPRAETIPRGISVVNGMVYFAEERGGIGRLDPSTGTFTEWTMPYGTQGAIFVYGGFVYFSSMWGLGRLDPTTGVFNLWSIVNTASAIPKIFVYEGLVYFVDYDHDDYQDGQVGRLDPSSGVFTLWKIPTVISYPGGIHVDRGLVYFTEWWSSKIGCLLVNPVATTTTYPAKTGRPWITSTATTLSSVSTASGIYLSTTTTSESRFTQAAGTATLSSVTTFTSDTITIEGPGPRERADVVTVEQLTHQTDDPSVPNTSLQFEVRWRSHLRNRPDYIGGPLDHPIPNLKMEIDGSGVRDYGQWYTQGLLPTSWLRGPDTTWSYNWWLWGSVPRYDPARYWDRPEINFSPQSPIIVVDTPGFFSSRSVSIQEFEGPGIQRVTVSVTVEKSGLTSLVIMIATKDPYPLTQPSPLVNAEILAGTATPRPANRTESSMIQWNYDYSSGVPLGTYTFSVDIQVTPQVAGRIRFVPFVSVDIQTSREVQMLDQFSPSLTMSNVEVTTGRRVGTIRFSSPDIIHWRQWIKQKRTRVEYTKLETPVDVIPPTTTITLTGTTGSSGWYLSDVTVTLKAVDNQGGSGVKKTECSFDGSTWTTYTIPFTISAEGTTTLYCRSVDNAGNVEPTKTQSIKIDKTPPTSSVTLGGTLNPTYGYYTSDVSVTVTATDKAGGSGVKEIRYILGSGPEVVVSGSTATFTVTAQGVTIVRYWAVDLAGNVEAQKTKEIKILRATASWLPPMTVKDWFKSNQTIPIKFTLKDVTTNGFVHDEAVKVTVLGPGGYAKTFVFGLGDDNIRINDADQLYITNWRLADLLQLGTYTIQVQFKGILALETQITVKT